MKKIRTTREIRIGGSSQTFPESVEQDEDEREDGISVTIDVQGARATYSRDEKVIPEGYVFMNPIPSGDGSVLVLDRDGDRVELGPDDYEEVSEDE